MSIETAKAVAERKGGSPMRFALFAAAAFLFAPSLASAQAASPTWNASPHNWQNSPQNWNNSPQNWRNSSHNWGNSPSNPNSNGLYDGEGKRRGYVVPREDGVVNVYDHSGRWLGYSPTKRPNH